MITVSRHLTMGVPVATVWAIYADFGDVQRWSPIVAKSYLTSATTSGVGTSRHCDLVPRGSVEETIRAWDEGRRLGIDIDPAGPIANQEVTIDLISLHKEDAATTVRMTMAIELTLEAASLEAQLASSFDAILTETLAGLRHHLLTGETVTERTRLSREGIDA